MSTIKPIPFDGSTAQQRRDFASKFLNLPIDEEDDDSEIVAKIRVAVPNLSTIFVEEPDETIQPAGQFESPLPLDGATAIVQGRSGTLGQGDPRAVIHISAVESDDGRGNDDVIVGINGRNWQLQRGVDLPVPWRVVEALGLTIQRIIRHEQQNDGSGKVKVIETETKRFPIQLVSRPSEEEIAQWHRDTDNKFCP